VPSWNIKTEKLHKDKEETFIEFIIDILLNLSKVVLM
jgi:hypothetical protein